jgi:hypothetical protein
VILVRAEHNARRARRDVVTDVATDVGPLVEAVA